jgi:hypothetical protein
MLHGDAMIFLSLDRGQKRLRQVIYEHVRGYRRRLIESDQEV